MKNITIGILAVISIILFLTRGCGENKVVLPEETITKTDTIVISKSDTVTKYYQNIVELEKIKYITDSVKYYDTIYKDTLNMYVSNYCNDTLEITDSITVDGTLVNHIQRYTLNIPEKYITTTNTITVTNNIKSFRSGFIGGLFVSYPFNVGGAVGFTTKRGMTFLVQKDFTTKTGTNLCFLKYIK